MLRIALALCVVCCSIAHAADRPNVVVIVADDLGYADLGCQGSKEVKTPNIDTIAANGARFTSAYVSCPVCSPTRAGILTGRYQQRFGHEFNPGGVPPAKFGLPLDQVTIANVLKDAGYSTGIVGKWHEGTLPDYVPTRRGFDEFFGFLGGAHPYENWRGILHNGKPAQGEGYLTEAYGAEAVSFIERHKTRPFFRVGQRLHRIQALKRILTIVHA